MDDDGGRVSVEIDEDKVGEKWGFFVMQQTLFSAKKKETVVEAFKVPTKNGSISGNRRTRTIAEK